MKTLSRITGTQNIVLNLATLLLLTVVVVGVSCIAYELVFNTASINSSHF